jgi:hypothetical protein
MHKVVSFFKPSQPYFISNFLSSGKSFVGLSKFDKIWIDLNLFKFQIQTKRKPPPPFTVPVAHLSASLASPAPQCCQPRPAYATPAPLPGMHRRRLMSLPGPAPLLILTPRWTPPIPLSLLQAKQKPLPHPPSSIPTPCATFPRPLLKIVPPRTIVHARAPYLTGVLPTSPFRNRHIRRHHLHGELHPHSAFLRLETFPHPYHLPGALGPRLRRLESPGHRCQKEHRFAGPSQHPLADSVPRWAPCTKILPGTTPKSPWFSPWRRKGRRTTVAPPTGTPLRYHGRTLCSDHAQSVAPTLWAERLGPVLFVWRPAVRGRGPKAGCTRVFIFFFFFYNSRICYKLLKYIENGLRLGKIQKKFL